MIRIKLLIISCILIFTGTNSFAISKRDTDRPFYAGPQYPLTFMRTIFEPDAAWGLSPGDVLLGVSYYHTNSYVYSRNSDITRGGAADKFHGDGDGYSVYFDGEYIRQAFRFYLGLTDDLELQLTHRIIRFTSGNLDQTIEGFHNSINIGNQGREHTDRNKFEVYIWDNKNQKMVFSAKETNNDYTPESSTLGFKYNLFDTGETALSFKIASNFNQRYTEVTTNDLEDKSETRNFQDYNASLNFSSAFDPVTIHLAVAQTLMDEPQVKRGKKLQNYYFIGFNFHVLEWMDLVLQDLIYTSNFPDDKNSNIGNDINEPTFGVRFHFTDGLAFELGMVENQTQGPHNIDITLYTNLMFVF